MDLRALVRCTGCMMSPNTGVLGNGSLEKSGWNQNHPVSADDTRIVVQKDWNGWRTATARLADLENVHWFQPSGAPRPLIHAYVRCTNLQSGDLTHDCHSTSGPHPLLVCVLKSHTCPAVFEELSLRASSADRSVAPAPSAGRC
jgi:hypothetical protein